MNALRKIVAGLALFSAELIIILILFLASLLGFAFLTNRVIRLHDTGFDQRVFDSIVPYINATTTHAMVAASFLASQDFLLPANILLSLYFLVVRRHRWYSVRIPVVALGSFGLMSSLKIFFARTRPLEPVFEAARGFSYPSGHAMSAMTFYGLLIYVIWDKVRSPALKWVLTVLCFALILVIGFSRIYLRVHYASDVLAGFAMGIIWLIISLYVIDKIEKYTKKNISPSVDTSKQNQIK